MVARGIMPIHFWLAVSLVIATLNRGYFPNDTKTLLSMAEWAELACTITAAMGRGYAQFHNEENTDTLRVTQANCMDVVFEIPYPAFKSIFHRLGAMAEALQTYMEGDDQVANWFPEMEEQSRDP